MNRYRVYLHYADGTHDHHLVAGDSFAEAVMAGEVLAGDRPLRSLEVALILSPVAA